MFILVLPESVISPRFDISNGNLKSSSEYLLKPCTNFKISFLWVDLYRRIIKSRTPPPPTDYVKKEFFINKAAAYNFQSPRYW